MVDLSGKYQLEKDENAEQYFKEMGLSEENVKRLTQPGVIYEVIQEGTKLTVIMSTGLTLVFAENDGESEEPLFKGVKVMYKREGNALTMTSTLPDGRRSIRNYEFTKGGLNIDMRIGDVISHRVFKRM